MVSVKITPSPLQGSLTIPPSKSHTIRALLFALMASGKSQILNPLLSPDTYAMLQAIQHLGAKVHTDRESWTIEGVGGTLLPAEDVIQCGNSGQILRFIGALSALSPHYTVLTGDFSIRHHRPVTPLLEALQQLGAWAVSSRLDGRAPLLIRGPIQGGQATLNGEDSQPISGLLMLGAFVPLELHVKNPGEKPWIQLTLSWLDRFNIPYENHNFERYLTKGGAQIPPFEYRVPADFSSAAFPIAASLVTQSNLLLQHLDFNDPQGDRALLPLLASMGAQFVAQGSQLLLKKGHSLQGRKIDINPLIDALPILAVIGCFAKGTTEIFNGAIARKKESDRIHCIALELQKMGALIEETPDGLTIHSSSLEGSNNLQAHGDHRLAMALTMAALGARSESLLHGIECTHKSYPSFFEDLKKIGAKIECL